MTVKNCNRPFGYSVIYINEGYFFPSDICQDGEKYIFKSQNPDDENHFPAPDSSSLDKAISPVANG